MRPATVTDVPLDQYETEWTTLCAQRHNVLLEGPVAATSAALLLLQPHLRQPIVWTQPQAPLQLPSQGAGALVVRDVAALGARDQTRLLEWSSRMRSSTQIVSTTEGPLFALVTRGIFDARLYYRLNIMLLHVGPRIPTGSLDGTAEPAHRRVDGAITVPAPQFAFKTS